MSPAFLLVMLLTTLPPPVVVLDPGHGGEQAGAQGVCGAVEKDVTLDVSTTLGSLLTASGRVTPHLLRTEDQTLSLEGRVHRANQARAALFVSIHANASDNPLSRGVETYFLSRRAADRRVAKLALVENDGQSFLPVAEDDTLTQILDGLVLQASHLESQRLGSRIDEAVRPVMGDRGRGLLQAPFIVLRGAEMPAVLVEIGFLSNSEDCELLADRTTRQAIARALTSAILEHLMNDSLAAARQ